MFHKQSEECWAIDLCLGVINTLVVVKSLRLQKIAHEQKTPRNRTLQKKITSSRKGRVLD